MTKKKTLNVEIRAKDHEYIERYAKRKKITMEQAYAKLLWIGLQMTGSEE